MFPYNQFGEQARLHAGDAGMCLSLGVLPDAPLTAMNVLCDGAVCTMVENRVNNNYKSHLL